MKRKTLLPSSLLLCLFFFAACAPYTLVGGRYTATSENFVVDLPQGWRRHDLSADNDMISRAVVATLDKRRKLAWDVVRVTRDGLLLQQIGIGRIPLTAEFPHTKRKLSREMLPAEAAELISDNLRSNPNLTHQEIRENVPAVVGGFPGFKLHYTYQTTDRLTVEGLFYGAIAGPWLYYVLYEAPAQHYFNKDLQVFDNTRSSFQILKRAS